MKSLLIINSGSSTVKFSLYSLDDGSMTRQYQGVVDRMLFDPIIEIKSAINGEKFSEQISVVGDKQTYYQQSIEYILQWFTDRGFEIVAAGHRVVHGGPKYSKAVLIDDEVIKELEKYIVAMPLHQPFNLKGIKIFKEKLPSIPQVACFDTSFHSTCNPIAQRYAIADKYTPDGFRRYGFHGLSYEYIATQLPFLMPEKDACGKFIIAHLGSGSTMCAISNQRSVATSIGFTAVGGLSMGTRCDSIDPGAVLYLMDVYGFNTEQMRQIFYRESGLLGVSGVSSDMRDLLASDKPEAKLAVDIFVHRIYTHAGMLAAELEGIDGLVFTGGIGENAALIREMVCDHLAWLNVKLDKKINAEKIKSPTKISIEAKDAVSVWVIPTDEDAMIAKHAYEDLIMKYEA